MILLDTFSGIGGFHYSLNLALGKKIITKSYNSDIDKYADANYKYNFPNCTQVGDISNIYKSNSYGEIDILTGGFPCQSFSIAGSQGGFEDTRGTLFFYLANLLKYNNPKYFVFENVKNIVGHDKGKTFERIKEILSELNYNIEYKVLNTKDYGIPQNRERLFIVGIRKDLNITFSFDNLEKKQNKIDLSSIVDNEKDIDPVNYISARSMAGFINKKGGFAGRFKPRLPKNIEYSYCLCAKTQGTRISDTFILSDRKDFIENKGIFEGNMVRRLTINECEKLQGYPVDWTKYGINIKGEKYEQSLAQRYKQIGNSISINVVTLIMKELLKNNTI